jgi:allantoinase
MWTEALRRGFGLDRVVDWMCAAPARLAGLTAHKGALAVGRDADLTVWDPDASFTVDAGALHHKNAITPYAGETLRGVVRMTFVRGERVYDGGAFGASPTGKLLTR